MNAQTNVLDIWDDVLLSPLWQWSLPCTHRFPLSLRFACDTTRREDCLSLLFAAVRRRRREVMTDVFLASPPAVSPKSALFIAWGQLLTYDLALIKDNSSEPFDVPCNDGTKQNAAELPMAWCRASSIADRFDGGMSVVVAKSVPCSISSWRRAHQGQRKVSCSGRVPCDDDPALTAAIWVKLTRCASCRDRTA